jgi:hypothetical protein
VARRDRSTPDLLVLIIASTICLAVLIATAGVFVIRIYEPKVDLSGLVGNLNDVINTMIGLMAGYLAGRQGNRRTRRHEEEDE